MAPTEYETLGLRLAHVGINAENADEAQRIAQQFCDLLGVERRETGISSFAGQGVEVMNENGRGTHGHIGFHTDDMEAAIAFFQSRGYTFDEGSRALNADGSTRLIYFADEIGGFGVHLVH